MKKIIGIAIITVLFICLFLAHTLIIGLIGALIVWGCSALAFLLTVGAVYLITD